MGGSNHIVLLMMEADFFRLLKYITVEVDANSKKDTPTMVK
jgi:hypothetical protein